MFLGPQPQLYSDSRISEFHLSDAFAFSYDCHVKLPTIESFTQASTAGNSLKGLAVYLNLTNACQTLDDVSKVMTQVPKIALVTLVHKDQTTCTLQDLAENVQNAGYSVLIHFGATSTARVNNSNNEALLMIPVAKAHINDDQRKVGVGQILSGADRTYVDIVYPDSRRPTDELGKLNSYLKKLYFWFLIGPLITLEWMRRTRKFFWVTDSQDYQREAEERTTENVSNISENEIRTMEEGENETGEILALNYQASRESNPGREFSSQRSEEQPLLESDEYKRQPRLNESVRISFKKLFYSGVMCFSYIILFIAALPIAISSGGLSFFRFDDRPYSGYIFDILEKSFLSDGEKDPLTINIGLLLTVLLWSPFQIFCFLLYSRLACTTTWVVPINILKLIRSDWFASSISLLVLAVVVPFCTSTYNFGFFAPYNTVCTVCNMLFIIILISTSLSRATFSTLACA